jgi:hypothetical protein
MFSGKLYNGNEETTVTRVIFNITVKEIDGTVRWSRDFNDNITIPPLTTSSFGFPVTGDNGTTNFEWNIKEAYGRVPGTD